MKLNKIVTEIKNRAVLIAFSWIFTFLISYNNKKCLLFLTIYYNKTIYLDKNFYFITTNITSLLSSYLTISQFFTNQLIIIYILYTITIFLTPGLYYFEHKKIVIKLKLISIIICSCFVFTNNIILPIFWEFFGTYLVTNNNIPVYFEAKITEYIYLYKFIYYTILTLGLAYSLFYYYVDFLKKKLKLFKRLKKITILTYFIIATATTPPDVLSQIFVGLSLIVLNEILIFIILLKTQFKNLN